jgi:hypothetical protein
VDRRRPLERRAHPVAVVLDDVHDRQLPETGHVQRLVERTGVDHRLAHEADADLVAVAVLDRERDAGRERHVAADDAVTTKEVGLPVEEVHRAALAARAAIDATEELGHHGPRRDAARERLPVVPVGRDDVIVGTQHRQRAGADAFLADVQVAEAADLA